MKSNLFVLAFLFFCFGPLKAASIPDGAWQTNCNLGYQKNQFIGGNQISLKESFFKDKDCTIKSFEFKTVGLIDLANNETNHIDFVFFEIQLTVYNEKVIADFNQRQVCGLNNWQIDTPQTITGLSCALFMVNKESKIPARGDMKYGIYKIEDQKLFYGKLSKDLDGSTDSKRPLEYDPNYFKHLDNL